MRYIVFGLLFFCDFVFANNKVIELDVFAKKPTFTDFKVSPTGEYVAFTYEEGTQIKLGTMNRKTKELIYSFDVGENRQVYDFDWLNNERIGMRTRRFVGWLDGLDPKPAWLLANFDGSKKLGLPNYPMISTYSKDASQVMIIKRYWNEDGRAKPFLIDIYKGDEDYIGQLPAAATHSTPGVLFLDVDLNDELRVAVELDQGEDEIKDEDDNWYLHFRSESGKWKRLSFNTSRVKPDVNPLGFSADNKVFYFLSNHDLPPSDKPRSDLMGLFSFDTESGKMKLLYRNKDAAIRNGLYGLRDEVIGVTVEAGYPENIYLDDDQNKAEATLRKSIDAAFKGSFVEMKSASDNGNLRVIKVRSGQNPGDYYFYNKKANKVEYFGSSKPEVNPKEMAVVEPFKFKARDGLEIFGYLTIPNIKPQKNMPLVVYPHGGPYGVADRWRWDRRAQMLASRGYLVMQVNFRGSGGYGDQFQQAGYQEWGRKMQDDLTDATQWAIATGLADKNRICMHGVSYGGYASMNAVVKEPNLYKCTIPDAGPYELALQWDEADSFQKGSDAEERKKYYMNRMIGGYDFVKERSPVYHLDKLKAAVFIVHGSEDVRVPIENAYLLEEKLKEANKPYKKMYKEDAHGFQNVEYRIELYQEMLDFLDKHIGADTQ